VRLHTNKNSILILRNSGNIKQAEIIEHKQKKLNLKLVQAFRKKFTFCSVYFFFSDYSEFVLNGQLEKIKFLNDSLIEDSTISFVSNKFLIAEYGIIAQDTTKHFSFSSMEPNKNWSLKKENHYIGGASMGFRALLIKTEKFVQFQKPFPYYSRTKADKKNPMLVVKKMNRKLTNYYRKRNTKL
jgi:hypothetical protein